MASEITASTVLAAVLTLGGLIPDYFPKFKSEAQLLRNYKNKL